MVYVSVGKQLYVPSNENSDFYYFNTEIFLQNISLNLAFWSEWRLRESWLRGVGPQVKAPALGEHLHPGVPALLSPHGGGHRLPWRSSVSQQGANSRTPEYSI